MSQGNGHEKPDERDTLPALPPDAPEYAHVLFRLLNGLRYDVKTVQSNVTLINNYLHDPAVHGALAKLPPLYEPRPSDEVTRPGYPVPDEDTDPGPRN